MHVQVVTFEHTVYSIAATLQPKSVLKHCNWLTQFELRSGQRFTPCHIMLLSYYDSKQYV